MNRFFSIDTSLEYSSDPKSGVQKSRFFAKLFDFYFSSSVNFKGSGSKDFLVFLPDTKYERLDAN